MNKYLNRLEKELKGLIHLAARIASKNNMRAYLVGGFVRDLILGVKNLDLDIVIDGDGVEFAEEFAKALKARLTCHRRFRTATCIIFESNLKVDIATARKEFYPHPAHLPIVSSGTLKDDLGRRDFTINAMAISINKGDFGRLIDFYNGKTDLGHKRVRILHDLSFIDDPTRILRAIRFEKRYNFRIESRALECLKKAVKLKMLNKVQPQRLRDELIPILKEEHPLKYLRRMQELAGCSFINWHLFISSQTHRLLRSIEKQIIWFKEGCLAERQPDYWLIYLMGLLYPLDLKDVKLICRKFVFRKQEEKILLTYKRNSSKVVRKLNQGKIKPSTVFCLFKPLSYEEIIFIKASYNKRNIQKCIEDFLKIYNGIRIQICGEDLKKLGLTPGPSYQKILSRVLNAKLNGAVKTKGDELALIKKLVRP